jgi:hypothetical protein
VPPVTKTSLMNSASLAHIIHAFTEIAVRSRYATRMKIES